MLKRILRKIMGIPEGECFFCTPGEIVSHNGVMMKVLCRKCSRECFIDNKGRFY